MAGVLKFAHATESPFDTSLGKAALDSEIYAAKQIANFVLSMSGLTTLETLYAQNLARNHGILDNWKVPNDVKNPDEIYFYGSVLAVAHFYNKLLDIPDSEIIRGYEKCVRAVNSLTYFLHTPLDRTCRIPGPVKLSIGERWKLDRTWDICVCLLGAIKARVGFERRIHVGNIPIVHDIHYQRAVKMAIDHNRRWGQGRICPKILRLLTREEIEPFIQPYHLITKLEYTKPIEDVSNHFSHEKCTLDVCTFDADPTMDPDFINKAYHVPGCTKCSKSKPPEESFASFNRIANHGMPAVSIDCQMTDATSWWVLANSKTLAVSHVWRDGVWGTRNNGISMCVHNLLVAIARAKRCTSYWIDCVTIPEEEETRKRMIMRINSTFRGSGTVLCWDKGLASLDSDVGTMLLSLIVSPWHRRAWTLLEANRARPDNIAFLKWKENASIGSFELFSLKDVLKNVFAGTDVPLWIRSTLVELLPYSGAKLSTDAAGLLLSGRHATRPGDSETVWGLLRPIESMDRADDLSYDDPYAFADDQVDVAFISSNANRYIPKNGTPSWRPNSTNATAWVRTAYGGIIAKIVNVENGRKNLEGEWWAKVGEHLEESIDWTSLSPSISELRSTAFNGFALICPILKGDPIKVSAGGHSSDPVKGFFRCHIAMECNRAIIITQQERNGVWQWQGMVQMKDECALLFTPSDIRYFKIGSRG